MSGKKNTKQSIAEQMVTTFKAAPVKITMQFRKEISTLKQQESKLKDALSKTQMQLKKANNQQDTLTARVKTKATAALKKQLNAAKKSQAQIKKTLTNVTNQLAALQKKIKATTEKLNQFTLLAKNIKRLERQPIQQPSKKKKPAQSRKLATPKNTGMAPVRKEPTEMTNETDEVQLEETVETN